MAIPAALPINEAIDRIDALVVQVRDLLGQLDALERRITTLECVRRIDDHLVTRDGMSDDDMGADR
ncbi:MAG: hypothetical protein IPK85_02280 [Gemmatimonadetes bacterium]|nr:hypothetical protein [Gemmatimonadota bacterium]